MATSGVYSLYKITNKQNGDFYIGVTSHSVESRFKDHIKHAKQKKNNGHFYRAINKYGADNFILETICKEYSRDAAVESEILLILDMNPAYNSTMGGDGTWGHKISPDGRRRMSEIHKGNKYNLGRKWSEDQKKSMSEKKKGCPAPTLSDKMKETRIENFRKSAALRRKPVICVNDGLSYDSISHAANIYNIDKSSISQICNKKRNSIFGLKFQFVESQNGN